MVTLLVLGCAPSPPAPRLDSPNPDDRLRALNRLDREGILAVAPTLREMAERETNPWVRDAVLLHLGYSGDPLFLPLAEGMWGTPAQYGAMAGLAVHPDGCDVVARWWLAAERESGIPVDLKLYDAFVDAGGRCREELKAAAATLPPGTVWAPHLW